MIAETQAGATLLRFPELAALPDLAHVITTRPWNMACHCGPDAKAAVGWRRRVCAMLGLPFEHLTGAEQVHRNELAVVDASHAGAGRDDRVTAIAGVDGLLTDRRGVGLMVLSADCPLVLVFDPSRPALGVAHASWRCTVASICRRLVDRMVEVFGSEPPELWAGISPSAGPDRYVVGDDVYERAAACFDDPDPYFRQTPSGRTFDLWSANRDQLLAAGLRRQRVRVAGICTIQDERFFSYRRQGPETGRFALVAGLRSP